MKTTIASEQRAIVVFLKAIDLLSYHLGILS